MEVLDKDGNPINQAILTSNAQIQLNKLLPERPEPVEDREIKVKFEGGGLILRNTDTGMTTPVKFAIAILHYSVTEELIPFRLIQYTDKDAGVNITDAAIAELNFGEETGKLMFVYKEGEGGKVIYAPDKK